MDFTRINFLNKGADNTGKPRISAASLDALQDGIEEGILKAEAAVIPVVTSLPDPTEIDEVYYRFLDQDGYAHLWHLKYDAALTTAYKWHVLGRPELYAEGNQDGTSINTNQTGYTNLPEVLTPPLRGDYRLDWSAFCWIDAAGNNIHFSFAVNNVDKGDSFAVIHERENTSTGGWVGETISGMRRLVDLQAGQTVRSRWRVSGSTGNSRNRAMTLRPVRVG